MLGIYLTATGIGRDLIGHMARSVANMGQVTAAWTQRWLLDSLSAGWEIMIFSNKCHTLLEDLQMLQVSTRVLGDTMGISYQRVIIREYRHVGSRATNQLWGCIIDRLNRW